MALVDHPANGDHIAMEATIAQMAQRIADLERRRGEPVMKLEAERLWGGAGEYAVSFVKAGWLDECRRTGGEFMLYAEQSAPVAVVNLRNFANAMIDIALEGCDADGAQIQELAVEHGLLKPEHRTERCGDACSCAEYADFPVECFRKADELNQSRAS
jgi:hypothetical protein